MPDLIAQGEKRTNRWRRPLLPNQTIVLGRSAGLFSVPWDDLISRQHAELTWKRGELHVAKKPNAGNAIFVGGRTKDEFKLKSGEHFVIGHTTFCLAEDQVSISLEARHPVTEQTFSPDYLQQLEFRNADQRIDVISRLPNAIASAVSNEQLFSTVVNQLLAGIPRAAAVAIVRVVDESTMEVLHWDRADTASIEFQPSDRLIRDATGRCESVVHIWNRPTDAAAATVSDEFDWAFCTPVSTSGRSSGKEATAIYVAGDDRRQGGSRPTDPHDLRDDLKFTEIVASTLGSMWHSRGLERRQAAFGQFFSPPVLDALNDADLEEILAPRETEVCVLFCDLRGFSRESERSSEDLMGLLARVSDALGVLTRHILQQGGVIGDFHGDAAMGFWGWPFPQEDTVQRACQAALAIRAEFDVSSRDANHPLSGFRVGIGVATGRAVAGKIGTSDQVKVTVFGPVVNLASRLEGMTKSVRASILIDEPTANVVRTSLARDIARTRRLAKVRPYGLISPLEISELLPPESDQSTIRDEHIVAYEQALDQLLAGQWTLAFDLLHQVPPNDEAKDFLTVFIAKHNREPPENWDGVIPIEKG